MRYLNSGNGLVPFVLFAICFTPGCGESQGQKKHPVHGSVTLDGQPLERGTILFDPAPGTKGEPAGGAILNGAYQVQASAGAHVVKISGTKKTGKKMQKPLAPKGEMIEEEIEAVAPAYNGKSQLKQNVNAGDNKVDFAVKSK